MQTGPAEAGHDGIARAAASTGAATMASRVLGLVRDQVLAALFGAGNTMDAYFIAFRVPSLLRDLFAEGAMSAAFVPTFTRYLTSGGRAAAWRLGTNVINALIVVTGTLVVLGVIFTDPLIRLMTAADYALVPGKLQLTILLARIMLPLLTFVALAAVLMGMLNSLHRFFIPAFAPAMFNVVTIVVAVAAVPFAGQLHVEPITLVAVGSLGGGVAQLLVQWPSLRREGWRWQPTLDWRDPGLHRMLTLMGPGTIGLAATQVNLLVNQLLATREIGAPSWLNYAFRIMYLPIGLFGVSIGTAVLPAISRHLTQRNTMAARNTMTEGLSLMLMLNVPATVGLIVLAVPIVQLLLERRAFTPSDTAATAAAVQLYALGLVGYSVVRITSPAFYAIGRSHTPVKVSIATVVVNVVLNVVLARFYGFRGLALGTSIAALFNAATLLLLLRRDLGGLNGGQLLRSFVRIGAAAAVMGATALVMDRTLSALVPGTGVLVQAVRLATVIGVSLVVLASTARLLRIQEFTEAFAMITQRVGRRR